MELSKENTIDLIESIKDQKIDIRKTIEKAAEFRWRGFSLHF